MVNLVLEGHDQSSFPLIGYIIIIFKSFPEGMFIYWL